MERPEQSTRPAGADHDRAPDAGDSAPKARPSDLLAAQQAPADSVTTESRSGFGEDRITPLVAEIRERLSSIASRELELQRREAEWEEDFAEAADSARSAIEKEFAEARAALKRREAELAKQAEDLETLREALEAREADIGARAERIERAETELARGEQRLERRREADRAQRQEERLAYRRRLDNQQKIEQELQRRVELARQEISAQRETLNAEKDQLDQRKLELDNRKEDLDQLATELEPLSEKLSRQQAELRDRETELADQFTRLKADQETLHEREQEFEAQWRRVREHRGSFNRQNEELDGQRRELEQQRTDLAEQTATLEAREHRLIEQRDKLAAAEANLVQRASAIEQREQRLTADREALETAEQQIADEQTRLQVLAADLEQRRTDIAQNEMSLELQTQALEQRQLELDEREQTPEPPAQPDRSTSDPAAEPELHVVASAPTASPRFPWLRTTLLSLMTATAAAAAVWLVAPPTVRTTLALDIQTNSRRPGRVAADHAQALLDDDRIRATLTDVELLDQWQAARAAHDIWAEPAEDAARVRLQLDGRSAADNRALLAALVAPYAEAVNAVPAEPQLPPTYAHLADRRDRVAADHAQVATAVNDLAGRLEQLPDAPQRAALAAEVADLATSHRAAADQLAERRQTFDALRLQEPRGTVSDEQLAAAQEADPVYQQAQQDYLDAADQYHREFGVALLLVGEPLEQLATALTGLAAQVTEQRELKPPADVALLLEQTQTDIDDIQQTAQAVGLVWPQWRTQVDAFDPAVETAALIELHNTVIADLQRTLDAADQLVEAMQTRITELDNAGDGGTRQVVVAAVLRTETRQIEDAAAALREAFNGVSFTGNFELDAQYRRLRGLRTRLNQREQIIAERLQAEADTEATAAHNAAVDEAREALLTVEDAREQRLVAWAEKLTELQRLDEQLLERRHVEVELATQQEAETRLQVELADLDAELAELQRTATTPDRIDPASATITHAAPPGQNRPRDAAIAATAAFTLTWLLSALLLAPRRS